MTDLRKAAEMALEALEELKKDVTGKDAPEHWDAHYAKQMHALDALDALRQALAQPDDIQAAVLAEREACAKVCESLRDEDGYEAWGAECAAAIRARGDKHD